MNYTDEDLLPQRLSDLERSMIADAFHKLDGNISQTARILGVSRANLYRKLKLYGLYPRKTGIISKKELHK